MRTRGELKDGQWVVNGQKIWTSNAHYASRCILLYRTAPEAPKHRELSYYLLDMSLPGVTVRPLINMANKHGFNELFLEDVRIPVSSRLGDENRGWYIATTTLDFERSSIGGTAASRRLLDDTIDLVRAGKLPLSSKQRTALADLVISCEVGQRVAYYVAWLQSKGGIPNREASAAKLFATELSQRVANTLVNIYGLRGQVRTGDGHEALEGLPIENHMRLTALTIAGGTSEIQRNIIATRGLGLPRV